MMRNFEFRAWDKKTKEYFHISELWNSGSVPERFKFDGWTDNFGSKGRLKDIVIEQSTGLKDEGGVDIYEGDIVRVSFDGESYVDEVVWWGRGGVMDDTYPAFDLKKHSADYDHNALSEIFAYGEETIEVIGNIHENPELLEVKP